MRNNKTITRDQQLLENYPFYQKLAEEPGVASKNKIEKNTQTNLKKKNYNTPNTPRPPMSVHK